MGGGEEEKANKHLFNPPFLAEAENVEVEKTGSVQKRDGIQAVIPAALPSSGAHPMTGTGTLFEHPGGQIGVVGQPDFNYAHSSSHSSLSVVSNSSDFNTSAWVKSNTTGIYSCGIEEDPVVRVDEALIHVQSSVSGNKVITVWCSQVNPITVEECYDGSRTLDNRCYYMVRERDTGTVLISPRRLHSPAHSGFTNNPRYVHIALVDDADPHWVVVAAPELYQDNTQNYLTAASISVSLNTITYNKLSFVDGQTSISNFTAFDMHAGKYSDTSALSSYAHIIAQAATGSGHSDYIFRIDKTLTVSLFKALATNEVPEHCGAIFHDIQQGRVFTAVSNQDGIAGALPGDGETWVHGYGDVTYGALAGYPVKAFSQTIPAAWPSYEIGITGACTRLTICAGEGSGVPYLNTSLYVFGTQFWNPAGYAPTDTAVVIKPLSARSLERALAYGRIAGSKSMLNTKWVEVQDAYTGAPSVTAANDQASAYITTKGFKGTSTTFPMVGLAVTNGAPTTAYPLAELADKDEAKFRYKYPPSAPVGPASPVTEPKSGVCVEDQPSKHPMAVVVTPMLEEGFLRPIARFGADLITEAEDVFPFECGAVRGPGMEFVSNAPARWMSPGLSEVHPTEVAGEHLFVYKSRLQSGVSRLPEYNRLYLTTIEPPVPVGSLTQGVMFSTNAAGAFGGEEVRLNLSDTKLTTQKDREQTYFSGGYLGFFDGVDNGESDMHSSPGQPLVQLYASGLVGLWDFTRPTNAPDNGKFWSDEKAKYTFTLVYALYDEDGRVHRSAPSPERVVYHSIDWAMGGNQYNSSVALRYLMPPPTAFMIPGQVDTATSRAKKLVIEVYAKVENTMTSIDGSSDRTGQLISLSNFTLIDSFEPEVAPTLQQTWHDWGTGVPAAPVVGTSTTPWSVRVKEVGAVRSGFKFFGERHIYRPRYFTLDGQTDKDTAISDGEFSNTVLYTTGGVIENDPPPAFRTIHTANRRMWGVPSNNRSSVWYSKLLSPGKPPEWSAAFSITTPRSDGDIVAISSMDEKVVLFSKTAIFILAGDGPNNLGRGGTFVGPRKVAIGVGCVNRSSVVTGPFGIIFQSEKGLYALGRDLQVNYIGSKVEDHITGDNDVSSAVLLEEKSQVRFTLNAPGQTQLKTLCYDYFHGVWTVAASNSSVVKNTISSTVTNSKHTYLGSDGYITRDVAAAVYDGLAASQEAIVSTFTTAWIKLAGLQGYQRVKRVSFLGQHLGGKVSLSAQYNYNESVSTTKEWTDAEITALSTDPMQLSIHIPRQKSQSIRFVYSDAPSLGAAPAGGDVISSISIRFGAKQGLFKMSEGSKK